MKKNIFYLAIIILISLSFKSKAQVQGYWTNPINQVPFEVTSTDSTFQNDTLITIFDGEPTYYIDTLGSKIWNNISLPVYQAIFGYNTLPGGNPLIENYYDLLSTTLTLTGNWNTTLWDTLIVIEPWISNKTINLSSADLGALVGWDWNSMNIESADKILDPTVPIIEGEDMDYNLDINDTINLALDFSDLKTNAEEIQAVNNPGIYTFSKEEFIETYNDFVNWMITTKPFFPNSFNYNTYHDWLYEYFNPIASEKIDQILTKPNYNNNHVLYQVSKDIYKLSGHVLNPTYNIFDIQGKRVHYGKLSEDNSINISHISSGIYIIRFDFKENQSHFKIIK